MGSPASPPASLGRVPPSVNEAPPSVDRDHPVNLLSPPELEPESLNPTTTVLSKARRVVSLWVNHCVAVLPALLLTRTSTAGAARSSRTSRRGRAGSRGRESLGRGRRDLKRPCISNPPARSRTPRPRPPRSGPRAPWEVLPIG